MAVAILAPNRIQDQQDFGSTPGAGNDGYSITWNNGTSRFVLTSVSGGSVSSVFGRTGAVVATTGDYTAAQVTNAAATNAANTFTLGQSVTTSGASAFSVTGSAKGSTTVVSFVNSASSGPDLNGFTLSAPSMIANDKIYIQIGKQNITKDGFLLGFKFVSSGSNSNKFFLAPYPYQEYFNFMVDGKFGIGPHGMTPSVKLHVIDEDAVTNAITNIQILGHNSTGTPDIGFGAGLKFTLESSTTADQDAARLVALWDVATHASRSAALKILISNTAEVDAAQFDDDATAGNTRFLVYDVDNGQLERVSVGAADSGGVGFKVLRIAN